MTANRWSDGALGDLRVVELASEAGRWCGRLLADLGADVIAVEPPGGALERSIGPFVDDKEHPEHSLSFWHYNAGKRAITLDIERPEGRDLLSELLGTADVLLETLPPGHRDAVGLGDEALSSDHPELIVCSLTPFGQTGPWRDYLTTDLVQLAAGGQMASCGYDADEFPDAPPIAPGGGNAWHIGSHYALLAISAAVLQRDFTGRGQHLDVSIHEACSLTTEAAVSIYLGTGRVVRRQTGRHAAWSVDVPKTQYRCADGTYVNAMFNMRLTPETLRGYAEWMDEHGAAGDLLDARYNDPQLVAESQEHIVGLLTAFFSSITSEEAYRGAQARGQAWGAVRTVDDIIADPHWRERGAITEVEHEELGESVTYVGASAIWSASPMAIRRRPPLVGEHNAEVFGELGVDAGRLQALRNDGTI